MDERIAFVVHGTASDLPGAKVDAQAMYSVLVDGSLGACNAERSVLALECATHQSFHSKLLAILDGWKRSDQLIFYFAGHGEKKDLSFFFKIGKERYGSSALLEELGYHDVQKAVLIVDACASATIIKGARSEAPDTLTLEKGTLDLGYAYLTSCRVYQKSYGLEDGKGGVFTTLLIEVIRGGIGLNPTISVGDALDYIKRRLADPEFMGYEQNPRMRVEGEGSIWVAKNVLAEGNSTDPSSLGPCEKVGLGGLDWPLVVEYAEKRQPHVPLQTDKLEAARGIGLLVKTESGDEVLHNAAVLSFGKTPERWFPQVWADFIDLNDPETPVDYFGGALSSQVRSLHAKVVEDFIEGYALEHRGAPWSADLAKLESEVLWHVIANAALHRDYKSPTGLTVTVHLDTIVVRNPGEFPTGIRGEGAEVQRLLPVQQNEHIFEYASALLDLKGAGSGLNAIQRYRESYGSSFRERSRDLGEGVKKPVDGLGEESDILQLEQLIDEGKPYIRFRLTHPPPEVLGAETERPPSNLNVYGIEKLPGAPRRLVGRESFLADIDMAWHDPAVHIISIIAWGGQGKSALVHAWLNGLGARDYPGFERVYGWSFYDQGTKDDTIYAELFMNHAQRWFGDPDLELGSRMDKGIRLGKLIKEAPTLLLLDGLEPLQLPTGDMVGRFKDDFLRGFLTELLSGDHASFCVVTTRLPLTDLECEPRGAMVSVQLPALSLDDGVLLLQSLGVRGPKGQFERAVENVEFHPLTLVLLGNYLVDFRGGDVAGHWGVVGLASAQLTGEDSLVPLGNAGRQARRVMAAYATAFQDKAELSILYLVGLFDRPASAVAFAALRKEPAIRGLTDLLGKVSDEEWDVAVATLRRLNLLSDESAEPHVLDAHPLIREYFGHRLADEHPDAWRLANERLFEYYADSTEAQPTTVPELDRLYAAIRHASAAGLPQEAFDQVLQPRIWRGDERFSTRSLGLIGADLAGLSNFFVTRWSEVDPSLAMETRVKILTDVGVRLRSLGRFVESRECFADVIRLAGGDRDIVAANDAAYAASQYSELLLIAGNVEAAMEAGRAAIEYADEGGDAFFRMHGRTSYAEAAYLFGDTDGAEAHYDEARIVEEEGDSKWPFLYSQTCYRYCMYLCREKRASEVFDLKAETQDWGTRSGGSLLSRAIDQIVEGAARIASTDPSDQTSVSKLILDLEAAIDAFRAAGYSDYLCRGLIVQARGLTICAGPTRDATARLAIAEARMEVDRGGMRLLGLDVDLESIRLEHRNGKLNEASAMATRAIRVANDLGYRRIIPDLKQFVT